VVELRSGKPLEGVVGKIKEIRLEGIRFEKVETDTIIVPLLCDQTPSKFPAIDSSDTIRALN
jgi:hypothetical protein